MSEGLQAEFQDSLHIGLKIGQPCSNAVCSPVVIFIIKKGTAIMNETRVDNVFLILDIAPKAMGILNTFCEVAGIKSCFYF